MEKVNSHKSRNTIQHNYDRLSRWYDLLTLRSESKLREIGLACLSLQDGEKVLEIGSGTGMSLLAIDQRVKPCGHVSGIDLSPGMLRKSHDRLFAAKVQNASLVCGDGLYLPYKNKSFNAIFLSFTLELFDSTGIAKVLAECRRVLRADGRFSIVALSKGKGKNWMMNAYETIQKSLPSIIDCRPIDLKQVLRENQFECIYEHEHSLWGLSVSIALAQPHQPPRSETSYNC